MLSCEVTSQDRFLTMPFTIIQRNRWMGRNPRREPQMCQLFCGFGTQALRIASAAEQRGFYWNERRRCVKKRLILKMIESSHSRFIKKDRTAIFFWQQLGLGHFASRFRSHFCQVRLDPLTRNGRLVSSFWCPFGLCRCLFSYCRWVAVKSCPQDHYRERSLGFWWLSIGKFGRHMCTGIQRSICKMLGRRK